MKKIMIKDKLRFLVTLIGFVFSAFIAVSLLLSGKFWAWLFVFPYFAGKLQAWTGMGYWLARGITIPLAMFFIFYFPWIFSWTKNKRTKGLVMITVASTILCFAMAEMNSDRNFDTRGNPIKCVAENEWGILEEISCSENFHPISNVAVRKMTPEIARRMALAKSDPPPIVRVNPDMNDRLFTPDGKPLLWYYQYEDGRLEFFPEPGMHPGRNLLLAPINTQVAKLLHKYLAEGRQNMIVVSTKPYLNRGGGKSVTSGGSTTSFSNSFSALKNLSEILEELGG